MKKLLWIALASVAVVGCKKNSPDEPTPSNGNQEIKIGATQGFLSKALVGDVSKFNTASQIGVFSVLADATPAFGTDAFKTPLQNNLPYGFNGQATADDFVNPSLPWVSLTAGDMLKWQFEADKTTEIPVFLVAYHPYNQTLTRDAATGESMDFQIPQDQTLEADYNTADLMWAASTGQDAGQAYESLKPGYSTAITGTGIVKSKDLGKNINLEFNHMLTRLHFKLGFYKSVGATEDFAKPIVKKIEVTGSKITNNGKLNLKTGVFTQTPNVAPAIGSQFWADAASTVEQAVAADKAAVTYAEVCDFISAPAAFDAISTDNMLKFTVEYQYTKDKTAVDGVGDPAIVWETKTKTYTFILNTNPLAQPAATDFDFKRNDRNNFKVALNLASDEIYVTSTIVEWNNVEHEVEGN